MARTPPDPDHEVDLASVLEPVRDGWHGRFASVGRPLRLDHPTHSPPVRGTAVVLRHVLDVLLDNALVHGAGEVRITTAVSETNITLTVSDEGPGFDEIQPAASDESMHGMGLPLAARLLAGIAGRLVITRRGPHPSIDVVLTRSDAG
jgi:signal transduction histidine kinase